MRAIAAAAGNLQRLIERLQQRLPASFQPVLGAASCGLHYDRTAVAPDDSDWICWMQPLNLEARAFIAAGFSPAAWHDVSDSQDGFASMIQALSKACALVAAEVSDLSGIQMACGEGSRVNSVPRDGLQIAFQLEVDGKRGPTLTVVLSQAVLDLVEREPGDGDGAALGVLLDLNLPITVSLGRAQLPLEGLLKLATGSVVELDRSLNDSVEVLVNGCVIARGEIVVVEGNYGVRIQEVHAGEHRTAAFAGRAPASARLA